MKIRYMADVRVNPDIWFEMSEKERLEYIIDNAPETDSIEIKEVEANDQKLDTCK